MRKLSRRSKLAGAALGVAGVLLTSIVVVDVTGSERVSADTLSPYQLEGLGLNLRPLAEARLASPVTEDEARINARARASISDEPEVLHVLAEITPGVDRSVWMFLEPGGSVELPLGPYGEQELRRPEFTGVAVDDQTGEVLLVFYGGSQ